jgi:hypothetical protein
MKRARESAELYEKLMSARPSQELVGLLGRYREQPLLGEVLRDLLPTTSLPQDLKPLLGNLNQTSAMPIIFLAVAFAQAERFWSSLLGENQKLFGDVLKELGQRKPDRQRSRGGAIDPDYEWDGSRKHRVPQLAAALGVTSEGLRRMCRRKAIRIKAAPAAKRAGTISASGARRLLAAQLKRAINLRLGMRERIEVSREKAAERKNRIQVVSGDDEAPNIFSAPS